MSLKVRVVKEGREKNYEISTETSEPREELLEALEAAGARMPYGCRAGACGSCRVIVHAGREHLTGTDPVEDDTLARGGGIPNSRLACRAKVLRGVHGALDLEVPDEPEVTGY